MLNLKKMTNIHLVGIGGINMSAVAKLLLRSGFTVTGSDVKQTEITDELAAKGVKISIGPHDERQVSADCQLVVHTSAAPDDNPERVAAKNRHLPDLSNFEWLGEWFKDKKVVLVTGTHGKSTTTGLLAAMCIQGGLDPTVIIGSKMPDWPDGNLRLGESDLVIIEGDEYAKHFLSFHAAALIINNIELDHVDVFKDIDDMRHTFERLLRQTKVGAIVVYNADSDQAAKAVESVKLHPINSLAFVKQQTQDQAYVMRAVYGYQREAGRTKISLKHKEAVLDLESGLFGEYNVQNTVAAALMARELGVADQAIMKAVRDFLGIWRRMELLGECNGAPVYSDYGHHPTAVRSALDGLREAFPDKRIVLCFQPHHKNRTKELFNDFVTCFDRADVLVLCEIYDVAGRNAKEDEDVSSKLLLQEIQKRETARPLVQIEYAPDPESAVSWTLAILQPGDVGVVMGAGDIDEELRIQLKNIK